MSGEDAAGQAAADPARSAPLIPAERLRPLSPAESARYARHLTLWEVGARGQQALRAARVLVVGAGGLGAPIIQYLAAAGVGHLSIIDDDVVELSNLQRQVIHREEDLGRPKAESARDAVLRLDHRASVRALPERLGPENALPLFEEHDVVLDGADNFATRYLSSDAAEITGTPLVWGTISQFSGQVSVFAPGRGPMLRDLYPDIPPADSVPSCAAGGVLGAVVGQVGALMAVEAIKLITGIGRPAIGRLLLLDALAATQRELRVERDPGRSAVETLHEVAAACGTAAAAESVPSISLAELLDGPPELLLDIREPAERAGGHLPGDRALPLGRILEEGWAAVAPLAPQGRMVLYCRSGARSERAVRRLLADPALPAGIDVRSLSGGYLGYEATTLHP